ncbi:UPF0175 family protein [Candidatus Pacearchaeota archaeon]|nr:UPF0175 family protein [Candidatus Pacearchaeota archaeon]
MEQPIGIRLPKDMIKRIENLGKSQMEDRSTIIRKLLLVGYLQFIKEEAAQEYIEGKITITEAAKKSNLTVWEMEKYLVEKGYKSEYSIDDLEKELKLLKK